MSPCMKLHVLCVLFVATLLGSAPALCATAYSYSPRKNVLKTWEPMAWDHGTDPGDKIEELITDAKTQGYTADRYQDTVKDDGKPGGCTRDSWDTFPSETGVGLVDSHGNAAFVVAATIGTDERNRAPADAWANAGTGRRGLLVRWWNRRPEEGKKIWDVSVKKRWFARHWRSTFNANRSIVVIATCKSAVGRSNALRGCGGRIGFGYTGDPATPGITSDMGLLFGRMDGTLDDALKRRAGDAYAAGGFHAGFRSIGNDDTTLCPSVRNDEAGVWAEPVGDGAGRSDTGYVFFDTYCDATVPASEALTFTVVGDMTIPKDKIRWVNSGAEGLAILFDYHTDCLADYEVTMTVEWEKLVAEGGGNLHLDGGKPAAGEDLPDPEGVAPNEDHFVWKFRD